MKKNTKLLLFTILSVFIVFSAACSNTTTDTPKDDGKGANKDGSKKVVTIYDDAKRAEEKSVQKMYDDFTAETGIEVQRNIVPGDGIEIYKKIDVDLIAGEKTDIIRLSNPILIQKYASNGWLAPLDDFMAKDNYDAKKVFGDYLPVSSDQKTYVLPYQAGKWAVFYNKKIFDDAGVPYPKGDWTWDQYIETAKKLTNKEKGIYGSYMLDYDFYIYMLARQYDVSGYKADGTSNYDDPKFAEALKFFGDLGNKHKIQPSWLEFSSKKLSWDGFMSGNYGMHFIGTWYSGLFSDKETYPRDWNVGVTKIPVPADGKASNNFGVVAGHGINKNAAHPEEAYIFVKWMAENLYKYSGDLPARVDLTDEDLIEHFRGFEEQVNGEITAEDLNNAFINDGLGFVDEKLLGPAAAEYSQIILQEAELYLVGQKSLKDTVKAIKERADKAIKEAGK
ncbi:ABC transporter substrate-binding protein [Neobacillus kokaensis]|uniref:Sugar ABC transporter substrate-binding protein n=1 Tax=Neobacillus kokaensis TaxID=2759023 RepID=A0ABQ3NA85_9BACI|nr:sugar ABC transporter substrate-binding protein [Neobacillus kokaensis]GHH99940.1 sugar ABC transporter substrate-binding protein [Neobacillus kokaensis]